MPLERYALGQGDNVQNFCRRIEFNSPELGSMKGGSSRKLIIYKRRHAPDWYFDETTFPNVDVAWNAVRADFVAAFELARDDRVSEIDELATLRSGAAIGAKAAAVYSPDTVFPIYSQDHLEHFSELLTGIRPAFSGPLHANAEFFKQVRAKEEFTGWDPIEIMKFLYQWRSPNGPKIIKIALGPRGSKWPECQTAKIAAVGWDEVGDLREYGSFDDLKTAVASAFEAYPPQTVTQKANELWLLLSIEPGDRVVTNRGTTEVIAVGTVRTPYKWQPARAEFKHTIGVDWDESFAKKLDPPVKRWVSHTIDPVKSSL